MEKTSDVMTTWAWGLRRYAWLVVLLVVGLGVLVPLAQSRADDVYQAQAQVGPTNPLHLRNLDPLPRFAQSVFDDGAVAIAVRDLLGLSPSASVVPGTVRLQTAQDNPVMIVIGEGSSPTEAAAVANKGASAFVGELDPYAKSVGTFAVQSSAVAPAKPEPKLVSGPVGVAVGLAAGLVAGFGAVGLVVALRRPVVGTAAAGTTSGLPVLGRAPLARRGPPLRGERMAVGALGRRLLRGEHDVVHVTGPDQVKVKRVAASVSQFLNTARESAQPSVFGSTESDPRAGQGRKAVEVRALDPASLETWVEPADRCSMTLLVVPEGIRSSALRRLVDQRVAGSAGAVFLTTTHVQVPWRRRAQRATARRRTAGEPRFDT